MKTILKAFAGIAVLLALIFTAGFIYLRYMPYTKIIDMNWSIKLPSFYKEIYSIDSGPSFHGDGERYHIFQYTKTNTINNSVQWEKTKSEAVEKNVFKVLSNLKVPNEKLPNFLNGYKYFIKEKDDSSKIYLIFVKATRKLYVIEDIY